MNRLVVYLIPMLFCSSIASAQFEDQSELLDDPFGASGGVVGAISRVVLAAEGASVDGANAATDEAKAAAREKERLDTIGKLTFDRRPSTILKLWAQRGKAAKAEAAKAANAKPDGAVKEAGAETETKEAPPAADDQAKKEDAEKKEQATASEKATSEKTASEGASAAGDKSEEPKSEEPKREETASGDKAPQDKAPQAAAEQAKQAQQAAAEAALKAAAEAKAEAERLAKEKQEFTKLLTSLTEAVTLGEWDLFRDTLADRQRLSEPESVAIYNRMIDQLGAQVAADFSSVEGMSKEMQQLMKNMLNNQRNNAGQRFAEKHSLSFADMVAILRATPMPLKNEQVVRLARLLRTTLNLGNQLNDFVATLKSEGDKLLPKQQAALLLSSASQDEFTADFLPTPEEAIGAGNRQALNLLARHYLALHQKELQESFREEAWKVTLAALEIPSAPEATSDLAENAEAEKTEAVQEAKSAEAIKLAQAEAAAAETARKEDEAERSQALTRAVSLAPQIRSELGKTWLADSFTKYPERGQEIMAKIGTATAQLLGLTPQDEANRTRNLELQHTAVKEFFATNPKLDSTWTGILNLLASNWLQEAEVSRQYSRDSQYGPSMRRDSYGNIYYANFDEEDPFGQPQPMQMGGIAAIKIAKVLETSPSEGWFEAIDASIRPQFTMALCRLWLKVNEEAKAFPYIEQLASSHPDTARELAEEFLKVWTTNHNPNEQKQRTNYYMFMFGYEQKADKIPLTRSKQERNLLELSDWLNRLRALPLNGKLSEELLVKAFMTCHSVAEVYDLQDIEKVFGQWDGIEAETMASLIEQMRSNLVGQWRDPTVQRDAKTNRKKSDIEAAVVKGYAVANRVLDKALEKHPGHWQLLLAKASVMHDENDYLQEVSPSSEFSVRRNAAFDVFAAAADAYVKAAPDLPERDQQNSAFESWFYAALGAVDLRGISEKNRAAENQFEKIAASMNALSGELGTRHRDRFANALFTRMSAVSPSCKFRYVEAGFQLVGDNPQAAEAQKVYNYYKDLVTEMQLIARIDGDAQVGHKEPFGVYVDLRHTVELEREAGGFSKYLQNQNNALYAYNYGRPLENYRDKFSDSVKLALEEHFEVLSVTFNHSDAKSIAADAAGWRVTPYAHLLLKARGPQVDKLPPLKIDLDFLDTSGYVVLPVTSAPMPIDAKSESETTASNVKLVQVLDERQSKEGKLIVEAKATARGLIPSIDSILDTQIEGYEVASIEDSGVSVVEFDKEALPPEVLSERTWTIKFAAADPAAPAPKTFAFPEPKVELLEANYQRYVDADLQEVEPKLALVADYGSNRRAWTMGILFTVSGLILAVSAIILVRKLSPSNVTSVKTAEEATTPFTLLAKLQYVASNSQLAGDKRERLYDDILALESYYFAESSNAKGQPDLAAIASRWS